MVGGKLPVNRTKRPRRTVSPTQSRFPALTKARFGQGANVWTQSGHARTDRDTAQADLEKIGAQRSVAQWRAVRATFPRDFSALVFQEPRFQIRLRNPASVR